MKIKKNILFMMLVVWITTLFSVQRVAAQNEYGFGIKSEMPLLYQTETTTWYLDRSSILIKKMDDRGHEFAENIVVIHSDGTQLIQTIWFSQDVNRADFLKAYKSYDGESWQEFDVANGDPVDVNAFKAGWQTAFGCNWS